MLAPRARAWRHRSPARTWPFIVFSSLVRLRGVVPLFSTILVSTPVYRTSAYTSAQLRILQPRSSRLSTLTVSLLCMSPMLTLALNVYRSRVGASAWTCIDSL